MNVAVCVHYTSIRKETEAGNWGGSGSGASDSVLAQVMMSES